MTGRYNPKDEAVDDVVMGRTSWKGVRGMKTWIKATTLFGILGLASGCGQGDAAPAQRDAKSLVGRPAVAPQGLTPMARVGAGHTVAPVSRPKPPSGELVTAPAPPVEEKKADSKPAGTEALVKKEDDKTTRRDDPPRRGGSRTTRFSERGQGDRGSGDRPRSGSSTPESQPPGTARADMGPGAGATLTSSESDDDQPFAGPGGFGGGVGSGFGTLSRNNYKRPNLPSNIPGWFVDADKDGDGQIGMHEWPRDRLEEFEKFDRNADGIITIEEVMRTVPKEATTASTTTESKPAAPTGPPPSSPVASGPPVSGIFGQPTQPLGGGSSGGTDERTMRMVQETIRRYDRNGDGSLDAQELQENWMLRNNWQQHDTNKDGKLDANEIAAAFRNMSGGRGGFGGGGQRGGGGPGMGGPGGGGPGMSGGIDMGERATSMVRRFDRNSDGKLSRDEFPTFYPKERFDEFDTNKDGFIDANEMKVGMERTMPNMGRGGFGGRGGDQGGGRGGFGGDQGGGRGGFGGDQGGGRGGFGGDRGGFGGDRGGDFRRRDR